GYTYHRGKATFLLETLVENIARKGIVVPDAADPAATAKALLDKEKEVAGSTEGGSAPAAGGPAGGAAPPAGPGGHRRPAGRVHRVSHVVLVRWTDATVGSATTAGGEVASLTGGSSTTGGGTGGGLSPSLPGSGSNIPGVQSGAG